MVLRIPARTPSRGCLRCWRAEDGADGGGVRPHPNPLPRAGEGTVRSDVEVQCGSAPGPHPNPLPRAGEGTVLSDAGVQRGSAPGPHPNPLPWAGEGTVLSDVGVQRAVLPPSLFRLLRGFAQHLVVRNILQNLLEAAQTFVDRHQRNQRGPRGDQILEGGAHLVEHVGDLVK